MLWLSYQPVARLFVFLRKGVLVGFLEVNARHPGKERRSFFPWKTVSHRYEHGLSK